MVDFMAKEAMKAPVQEGLRSGLIIILDKKANYLDAESIAQERGGRLPTLAEFLTQLNKGPDLRNNTRGNWLWLGDKPGLTIGGLCKIDYEKGTVEQITEREYKVLPYEQRAYAFKGEGQVYVLASYSPTQGYTRLEIGAVDGPQYVASRIAYIEECGETAKKVLRS